MNRKTLNKSGFLSFFKHKISAILLFIIIIISSMTFTVLSSTSSNYSTSYSNIIEQGNIHDHTLKELYRMDGKPPTFTEEKDVSTIHEEYRAVENDFTIGDSAIGNAAVIKFSQPGKYETSPLSNDDLVLWDEWGFFRVVGQGAVVLDLSTIDLTIDPLTNKVSDIAVHDDKLGMYVMGLLPSVNLKLEDLGTNLNDTPIQQYVSLWKDGYPADSGVKKVFISPSKFSTLSGKSEEVIDGPMKGFATKTWDEYKSSLIEKLNYSFFENDPNNIGYQKVDVGDIIIKPDDTLSGAYKEAYDIDPTLFQMEFQNVPINSISSNPSVIAAKETFLTKIVSKAKELKSESFRKLLQDHVKNNYNGSLSMQEIKAKNYSYDKYAFKVQTSDQLSNAANDTIDKLVMYDGSIYNKPLLESYNNNTNGPSKVDEAIGQLLQPENIQIDNSSGWKTVIKYYHSLTIPKRLVLEDPTAYQAVISPGYANLHNIKPITDLSELNSEKFINAINNNKININDFIKRYQDSISNIDFDEFVKKYKTSITGINFNDFVKKYNDSINNDFNNFVKNYKDSTTNIDFDDFVKKYNDSNIDNDFDEFVKNYKDSTANIDFDDFVKKYNDSNIDVDFNNFSKKYKDIVVDADFNDFVKKYKDSTVDINGLTYFVTGIGATPDTAYPIISSKNPIVNMDTQAILYTNKSGYNRFSEAFSTAEDESYLAIKIDGVSDSDMPKLEQEIEKMAHDNMEYQDSIQILSSVTDENEKILLAPKRIDFLSKINSSVSSITWLSLLGLITLTTIITLISIRRIISSEKKTLAILLANGYRKSEISGSYILPAMLTVLTAAILGYMLGIFLQPAFSHIFNKFWTIPVNTIHFSWIPLVTTVIVPLALIGLFVFIIGMWTLAGGALSNITNETGQFGSFISSKVINLFGFLGIKGKITLSFIFTNLGKLFLITLATVISVSTLSIGFVNANKYSYAVSQSNKINKYEYAVDLLSPTEEGGQYSATIPFNPNDPLYSNKWANTPTRHWIGRAPDKNNINDNSVSPLGASPQNMNSGIFTNKISTYHVPSANDAIAERTSFGPKGWDWYTDPTLPKDQIEKNINELMHYNNGSVDTMILLNILMGSSGSLNRKGAKVIPWDVAKNIFPTNSKVAMEKDYYKSLIKILDLPSNNIFKDPAKIIEGIIPSYNDTSENWYDTLTKIKYDFISQQVIQEIQSLDLKNSDFEFYFKTKDEKTQFGNAYININNSAASAYNFKTKISGNFRAYNKIKKIIDKTTLSDLDKQNLLNEITFSKINFSNASNKSTSLGNLSLFMKNEMENILTTVWTDSKNDLKDHTNEFIGCVTYVDPSLINAVYPSFIKFLINGSNKGVYPYIIAYNQVTMNVNDETYTSIRGKTLLKNLVNKNENINLSIKGVNKDTQFINLSNKQRNKLASYSGTNIPVVINKYMSERFRLSSGDTFDMDITNSLHRYIENDKPKITLEVMDVIETYSNNEVITLQNIANKVMNYDIQEGFNGVFTHDEKPLPLLNTNLYSVSGLYPADQSFEPTNNKNNATKLLKLYLESSTNPLVDSTGNIITKVEDFARIYSSNYYSSTIYDVQWARIDNYTFETVQGFSSSLIIIIESLAVLISIIFIFILGIMLVESNKKNISVMKVMGYREKEIKKIFIKTIIPSLIIGLLISIPTIFAMLILIKVSIMSFASVLIPLSMTGWEIILASVISSTIFIMLFMISIGKLNSQSALESFKE